MRFDTQTTNTLHQSGLNEIFEFLYSFHVKHRQAEASGLYRRSSYIFIDPLSYICLLYFNKILETCQSG